jgi:hypothetical protein
MRIPTLSLIVASVWSSWYGIALAAATAIGTFAVALRVVASGVRRVFRHFRPVSVPDPVALVTFANIAVGSTSIYWKECPTPERDSYPFDRITSQYVQRVEWVSGSDLPFDVTIVNRSNSEVVLTHVGVEVVSVTHLWATPFKGQMPEARKVERQETYTLHLPPDPEITKILGLDPDTDPWVDVGKFYWTRLPDPIYVPPAAPYRFSLCLTDYDLDMPDHVILRLAVGSATGSVASDDITVFVHDWTHTVLAPNDA